MQTKTTDTLIKKVQDTLRRFERKIVRRVYGRFKENDDWRIKSNNRCNRRDHITNEEIRSYIMKR